MAAVLITGGSGRLGRALIAATKQYPDIKIIAPSHSEVDITDAMQCIWAIDHFVPDIVIHCAAYVDTLRAETDRRACWNANVLGTLNICHAARRQRFVYISTDYVFDGHTGNYSEEDIPAPANFYGLSKLAGEMVVTGCDEWLVLRAPFRDGPPWKYPQAFKDQWTSSEFLSVRAPQILQIALGKICGILHIGGPRRSIFELARSVSPGVKPAFRDNAGCPLPRDTSLNSSKWHSLAELLAPSSRLVATSA